MKHICVRSISYFTALAFVLLTPFLLKVDQQIDVFAQSHGSPSSGAVGNGPNKYALLVGINNYRSDKISPLAGSINDVEDMRQLLIGKFNFAPENILVLTDAQATHAAIINAIKSHLIAKVHAGDIVVFDYSGHGSQMKDVTGKMISGLDETIVPYDSRDPEGRVFDISGAELHPLLTQLASKTENVTFILDSCHSGTLVRGARVRFIPPDTREVSPTLLQSINASRNVSVADSDTSPKFALISAATSRESAFEHNVGNTDHGALTYFLARQLRNSGPGATYRDVMDSVIGEVESIYPMQHVSLEGVEQNQHIFGDGSSNSHVYVVASPSAIDPRRITLAIGQAEGATVGSIYEVYPPGSKRFAVPEKPLGKAQIASVSALTAEATPLGGIKIPPASRAVERAHRYGSARMRLFFDGPQDSQILQSIKAALQPLKYFEIVDKPTLCHLQVREADGTIQTLGADSSTRSTPVPINDPEVINRVVGQLKLWAKWFAALSIYNAQSDINIGFTLKGSQTRDPMARVGRPDMGVNDGEVLDATLTNNDDRDVYVAILDLSSDGSISVVYPTQPGARAVLKAGGSFTRNLKFSVAKGRSKSTEVLKVFASFQPIDLTTLTQPRIRGFEENIETDDPLQELLNDSAGATRGVADVSSAPMKLGTWNTTQRVVWVRLNRLH